MGDIFQKAQKEQTKGFYQEILDKLEDLPADTPDWRDALKSIVDDIIQSDEQSLAEAQPTAKKEPWDFSREKSQAVFVRDDTIVIRPITPEDEEFYCGVRAQYSIMYKSAYDASKEKGGNLFISEISPQEVFYCVIEQDGVPAGYLGIKDTSAALWEIAIELDAKHTRQGLGPRSIRLYLNEIQRVTGRGDFKAVVEVDNLPSQKCFERLGAKLVGLCDSVVLKTDDEKRKFEEKNLDLIDVHMMELAGRLGVEPRTLLSHLLDYRLTGPL